MNKFKRNNGNRMNNEHQVIDPGLHNININQFQIKQHAFHHQIQMLNEVNIFQFKIDSQFKSK